MPRFFPQSFITSGISNQLFDRSVIHSLFDQSGFEIAWDVHSLLALYLAFFSRHTRIHTFIHSFQINDQALIVNNGEYNRDIRLLANKILRYLQPWGHGIFCFLWAFVTDQA